MVRAQQCKAPIIIIIKAPLLTNLLVTCTQALGIKLGDFGLSARMPADGLLSGWATPGAAPLDESAIGSLYA